MSGFLLPARRIAVFLTAFLVAVAAVAAPPRKYSADELQLISRLASRILVKNHVIDRINHVWWLVLWWCRRCWCLAVEVFYAEICRRDHAVAVVFR